MSTNTHFSRNNVHDTSCLEFSGQIVSVKTHPSISSGHLLMPYAPVTNGQISLTGWTYTHEARGQEDQLPGVEQKSGRPDPVALSSTEPALGQSTRETPLTGTYRRTEVWPGLTTLTTPPKSTRDGIWDGDGVNGKGKKGQAGRKRWEGKWMDKPLHCEILLTL